MDGLLTAGERGWISLTLTGILVFLVTAGVAMVPVSAVPVVVRNIEPDYVGPGEVVTVTMVFTTTEANFLLGVQDQVPLGWNVTDMIVNEEAFLTDFNATTGTVMFVWLGIGSGIDITAEYKLHVPLDAELGEYIIVGSVNGIFMEEPHDDWAVPIPNGTVVVERPYGVHLTADEEEKTTIINVNATYYLTVENIGTTGDSYELSVTSTDACFAELNKTFVSLGVGESEMVELKVASSSSGRYNTTVSATSAHASDEITVTTMVSEIEKGDVNEDGSVDFADVTYLANHVVGRSGYESIDENIANVNGDSSVDFADVTYLANHVVGRSGYEQLK